MKTWLHKPFLRAIPTSLLLVVVAGCAKFGTRVASTNEIVLRERKEDVPVQGKVSVTAKLLDHDRLRIDAVYVCRTRTVRDVGKIDTLERYNETPNRTWALAGFGVASAATGLIILADSSNVHPSDESSRTYNPIGPSGAKAIGGTFVGVGVIAGTLALVEVIKAQGTDERRERLEVRDESTGTESPCKSHPASDIELQLFAQAGSTYKLGTTGPKGGLVADLDAVLPSDFVWDRREVSIVHGDKAIATLDLTALFERREANAWQALSLEQCKTPKTSQACQPVRDFLAQYPRGPHAAEAQALIRRVKPELHRLADEEAWAAIEGRQCRNASFDHPTEVASACAPFRGYLRQYPTGLHADEARKILDAADKRVAQLERELEEERRRQERAAEAEARKEAQARRKRCTGQCRVMCSGRQFRDPASCFAGCVESQCSEEQ